jgi:hypothetical protein
MGLARPLMQAAFKLQRKTTLGDISNMESLSTVPTYFSSLFFATV